jgi:DNA-directed RNA polymerase subunit RPC12/RpoP
MVMKQRDDVCNCSCGHKWSDDWEDIYCRRCGKLVRNACSANKKTGCENKQIWDDDNYCPVCGSETLYKLKRDLGDWGK